MNPIFKPTAFLERLPLSQPSAMKSTLTAVIISFVSYIAWRFMRPFFVKSTLSQVPGPERKSWWSGHYYDIYNRHGQKWHHDIAQKYGGAVKIFGWCGAEQLYVSDPRALHHILVKDQYTYQETGMFLASSQIFVGPSLVATLGEHHRKQRKLLNPVFSMKHMKELDTVFYPIIHQLQDILTAKVKSGEEVIDIFKWMTRTALELLGQGGLGYSFNALDENGRNTYSEAVKDANPVGYRLLLLRECLPFLIKIGSPAFRRKLVELSPFKIIHEAKTIIDTMDAQSRAIFKGKKEAMERGDDDILERVGKGKDILSVMMRANMATNEADRLPENELIAQMSTIIFAGQATTAIATSRLLYVLSLHQDVQSKLREEIKQARDERGDPDYETLMNLPYLDAVVRETLRLYAPSPFRTRVTTSDIVLPLQRPVKSVDGKTELSEIFLKKNTRVYVSIMAANTDKAIWGEDADEWKPERWLKPLPNSVADAHLPGVYSSMMTFIGGGRACIGFKFAEMEIKTVISTLITTFVFHPVAEISWLMGPSSAPPVVKGHDKEPAHLPLKLSLV